jgi:hypothetical protein
MPTRPVTWDSDIPPDVRPEGAPADASLARETPCLADLRGSLIGTRFEFLKIATFAAFLCALAIFAVQGTDVANPDNQFAATTGVALSGLVDTVSGTAKTVFYSASIEGRYALARVASLGNTPTASAAMQIPTPKHLVNLRHSKSAKRTPHVVNTSFEPPHKYHPHRKSRSRPVAGPEIVVPPQLQWSGNLLDLPDFLSAKCVAAFNGLTRFVRGSASSVEVPNLHDKGESMVISLRSHLDVASPDRFRVQSPSTLIDGLVNVDTAVAAGAALLLYLMFVVVVAHRGSLRAVAPRRSTT